MGAVVLAFISVTTFAVHRPRRAWFQGLREDLDLFAIALWFGYNTCIVVYVIMDSALHGASVLRMETLVIACSSAVAVALLHKKRCTFQFRSYTRDVLHVLMHAVGATGTVLLLLAG